MKNLSQKVHEKHPIVDVLQKPTKSCKAVVLQIKIFKKILNTSYHECVHFHKISDFTVSETTEQWEVLI